MRERDSLPDNEDAYWSGDLAIGEARIGREIATVRLKLHVSEEPYHLREELFPLTHRQGQRTYVHAQPYILEPAMTLGIGLYPAPTDAGAIGEVIDSAWEGMRHRDLGNAQAWFYSADRVLVLWECFLNDFIRQEEPFGDETLALVWTGFERRLRERFPTTERIATPSWENLYERPAWQQFLAGHGYAPFSPGCFVKELTDSGGSASV